MLQARRKFLVLAVDSHSPKTGASGAMPDRGPKFHGDRLAAELFCSSLSEPRDLRISAEAS